MVASFRCVPVAHAFRRFGDALSTLCRKDRSEKVAFPAPPPLESIFAEFATPQEYDSTSISSLCLESWDSPLMSPIFAKMSDAILRHLLSDGWLDRPRRPVEN